MRTWQEKDSNGSGGPCGFSWACFPQPILACNILRKNKLAADLTHGKRPPLRAAFQSSEAGATRRLPEAQSLGVSLHTHVYTHVHTHSTPELFTPEQMLLPTMPATCHAWHFLLLSSWQLCPFFSLPLSPTLSSHPFHPLHVQILS